MDIQTTVLYTLFKKGSATTEEISKLGAKNPSAVIACFKHKKGIRIHKERITRRGDARYFLVQTALNRQITLKEINRQRIGMNVAKVKHFEQLEMLIMHYEYFLIVITITVIYSLLKWASVI